MFYELLCGWWLVAGGWWLTAGGWVVRHTRDLVNCRTDQPALFPFPICCVLPLTYNDDDFHHPKIIWSRDNRITTDC